MLGESLSRLGPDVGACSCSLDQIICLDIRRALLVLFLLSFRRLLGWCAVSFVTSVRCGGGGVGICRFMIPFFTCIPIEVYFSPAYHAISSVVFENSSPPFDVVTVYVNPSNSSHLPLNAISLGAVVCA